MKAKTYTLLVTIADDAPPDVETLARLVARAIEEGVRDFPPSTSAQADAFEGDFLGPYLVAGSRAPLGDGADVLDRIDRATDLHRALRTLD